MISAVLLAAVAATVAAGAVIETPAAERLVGHWTCERPASGFSFTWDVSDRHSGPWLIGEATLEGEMVALDVWAYDEDGNLGLRRQFSAAGTVLKLSPVSGDADRMELQGKFDLEGVETRMSESVEFTGPDEFNAQWRYFDNDTGEWVVDSTETCVKSPAAGER